MRDIDNASFCLDPWANPIRWVEVPSSLPAGAERTHLWRYSLALTDRARVLELEQSLSPDEHERARHFRGELNQNRYVVARGLLRETLSRYVGTSPAMLRFVYGANGKPALAEPSLHFNLSHSNDLMLVAVRDRGPVGVDLERIDENADHAAIAKRFFSVKESAALQALPPQHRATEFFKLWTRREAILKLDGVGMAALEHLSKAWDFETARTIHTFTPAENHVASIARTVD